MHIVLVDGSRTGLLILHRMLQSRGDEITLFMDGREALDYIRDTPTVDLLITSFEITTIPGAELCWEARILADAGRPIYVIAMSASAEGQNAIGVLDAGADDFMSKPPRQDELNARLRVAERTVLMQRRLIELATIDALSGILNRRAFMERSEAAIAMLDGAPLSMILFDVDHFKSINDGHGHDVGDQVIRCIGTLRVPPDAIYGRVGGEEFCIVLPYVAIDGALSVAEHLRGQIADMSVDGLGGRITFTASFGVAQFDPNGAVHSLYRSADAALYLAKNSGRNCVAEYRSRVVD